MKIHGFFPGSFSPFHDGHFMLVKHYLDKFCNEDFTLEICISAKNRDNINTNIVKDFIKDLLKEYSNVVITICECSPIKYVYDNTKDKNIKYILLTGNKVDDKDKRSELYEKYCLENDYIILDNKISTFRLNNKDISARDIRKEIKNDNYNEFVKYFQNILTNSCIKDKEVKKLFKDLKS